MWNAILNKKNMTKKSKISKIEKDLDKEMFNNILYGSNIDVAICETCLHYPRNLNNIICTECDDGDNWEVA